MGGGWPYSTKTSLVMSQVTVVVQMRTVLLGWAAAPRIKLLMVALVVMIQMMWHE